MTAPNDALARLAAALHAATPDVDQDKKQQALRKAAENFTSAQGSQVPTRPIHTPPHLVAHFWTGAKTMLSSLTLRPALYATSCLVVVGLSYVLVSQDSGLTDFAKPYSVDTQTTDQKKEGESALTTLSEPVIEPIIQERLADIASAENTPAAPSKLTKKRTASSLSGAIAPTVAMDQYLIAPRPDISSESFPEFDANPLKVTANAPVSTFSIDVDTASYAFARSSILNGQKPPKGSVRIEELINYFPYDYAAPDGPHPFSTHVSVVETPWNPDTKLVHIAVQGEKPQVDNRPPLDLVFLIDTSGSMQDPNKLPLLKQSFRLLLNTLRPEDKVAIVTYAGSAGLVLEPTSAAETATILNSLNALAAGGSTAGQAGLQQAYATAEAMQGDDRIGRVILATDGDFNVGISDPDALKNFIADKRDTGTYLSVLGFGRGNYQDALMQSLAQNGNGTAAYIDTLAEAQKVLVDQVSGALFPIANDVKIQVEFNPAKVAEYRLIGYETRALNRVDFNNDAVDAGEIGAGHSVTAIYEITPVGSPAVKNDPLRYDTDSVAATSNELGFLKFRYKTPGSTDSILIENPIQNKTVPATPEIAFASAIAGMGQLLSETKYLHNWGWDDAISLAKSGKASDPFGYRAEAIRLMQLSKTLH